MANKMTLAEEYKDIMVKWGDSRMRALAKAKERGEVTSEGYEELRVALQQKLDEVASRDCEELLQEKLDRTIKECENEIVVCEKAMESGNLQEHEMQYCIALKQMRENTLSMTDEERRQEIVSMAKSMLEESDKNQ